MNSPRLRSLTNFSVIGLVCHHFLAVKLTEDQENDFVFLFGQRSDCRATQLSFPNFCCIFDLSRP